MFHRVAPDLSCLRLVEASLRAWRPEQAFDLITCVHGQHYVGDKLGIIARATSWLAEDGLFVASLDVHNLKAGDGDHSRWITAELRRAGLQYNTRRRLVSCRGPRHVSLPYQYVGADDTAGPNYTEQPAVDSYYEVVEEVGR